MLLGLCSHSATGLSSLSEKENRERRVGPFPVEQRRREYVIIQQIAINGESLLAVDGWLSRFLFFAPDVPDVVCLYVSIDDIEHVSITQVSGVTRTLGRNSLKGQKAPSPGHRPGYKDMGKLALQGHKLYHASLCLCPFRAPCCASYLPRAMPWAGSFPAFQALSSGTSET